MNREMRKKERQASQQAVKEMLLRGTEGTLSMHGDDGYPYGLPVNYIYFHDAIYIHTLNQGYKIDALKANPKVCFSIIVRSEIIPRLYTARYESIVATGDAEFVENESERKQAMEALSRSGFVKSKGAPSGMMRQSRRNAHKNGSHCSI